MPGVLTVDSFLFSGRMVVFLQLLGLRGQRFDLSEQGISYLLVDTDDSHNANMFWFTGEDNGLSDD